MCILTFKYCSNISTWFGEEKNATGRCRWTCSCIQLRTSWYIQTDNSDRRMALFIQGNSSRVPQSCSKCWYCVYDLQNHEGGSFSKAFEGIDISRLASCTVYLKEDYQISCNPKVFLHLRYMKFFTRIYIRYMSVIHLKYVFVCLRVKLSGNLHMSCPPLNLWIW